MSRRPRQHPVRDLPDDVLPFLLGSRYCDTDKLSATAWSLFGATPEGWARVQAIVDFVHNHLQFDYQQADNTRTSHDGYVQRVGVCRDFAPPGDRALPLHEHPGPLRHWLPRRHRRAEGPGADGFLGLVRGLPSENAGTRSTLATTRRGSPSIVMARGRDATDCALTTSFGTAYLMRFDVHTDEVATNDGTMAEAA